MGHCVFCATDVLHFFSGSEASPKHRTCEINFSALLVVVINHDQSKTGHSGHNESGTQITQNEAVNLLGQTQQRCVLHFWVFLFRVSSTAALQHSSNQARILKWVVCVSFSCFSSCGKTWTTTTPRRSTTASTEMTSSSAWRTCGTHGRARKVRPGPFVSHQQLHKCSFLSAGRVLTWECRPVSETKKNLWYAGRWQGCAKLVWTRLPDKSHTSWSVDY